jgi:ethanolamine ammonia-lyase large subunit
MVQGETVQSAANALFNTSLEALRARCFLFCHAFAPLLVCVTRLTLSAQEYVFDGRPALAFAHR